MNTAHIIAMTQPFLSDDITGTPFTAEEFITYVARVSNPSNQNNTTTSAKLLKYLMKNKHYSPFEMVNIVMEINTTRDIARQILRHRSFTFQEFSQRYADPTKELGFVGRAARLQDLKNRQNSIEGVDPAIEEQWLIVQSKLVDEVQRAYDWARHHNIAKEQARALLPEGLTTTRLYMNGSLRSYWHFVSVRHHPTAQKEVREVAECISNLIVQYFPALTDAMKEMIEKNYEVAQSNH